jgi:hypothetical protein
MNEAFTRGVAETSIILLKAAGIMARSGSNIPTIATGHGINLGRDTNP